MSDLIWVQTVCKGYQQWTSRCYRQQGKSSERAKPPDKNAYLKIIFSYFMTKTYVVGTQKNRLNETFLLSTQNTCVY